MRFSIALFVYQRVTLHLPTPGTSPGIASIQTFLHAEGLNRLLSVGVHVVEPMGEYRILWCSSHSYDICQLYHILFWEIL